MKDYDQFIRSCASRSKFPSSLAAPFRSNKMEVFNIWLQNKKDLSRCAVAYRRRIRTRERARNLYGYRKERDLNLMYPGKPALVAEIMAKKVTLLVLLLPLLLLLLLMLLQRLAIAASNV